MYTVERTTVKKDKTYKYQLYRQEGPLSFAEFLALLEQTEEFRQFYIDLLANIPIRAYHWETPPVTKNTVNQPFEFVCSRAPGIDLPPDPGPFQQYFQADKEVTVFDNLGGDAKLIAPAPPDKQLNYSHIGAFTENAPKAQQLALWQTVGSITKTLISNQPTWLNTAGGGVAWLHVRLDSSPKYYRHYPYASSA